MTTDTDGDGVGDQLDDDYDGDGVLDIEDDDGGCLDERLNGAEESADCGDSVILC